jgi:hypothetical protein
LLSTALGSYAAVKAAGPPASTTPVWLNNAPRGTKSDPTNYSLLRPYADAADILSIDVYPVPAIGHAALPNEGPWSVGEYADILRNAVATWNGAQRKVTWMVLQGFDWWEETGGHDVGDHALAVEWRDESGNVLRVDTVGADRTNAPRSVGIDGLVQPAAATVAVVKAAAYATGTYSFEKIAFREQGGRTLISSSSPVSFAANMPRGEVIVGQSAIQAGTRYSLSATVIAQTRPTLDEERFMAWDAIIHGARGLSWFGFQYTGEADPLPGDIAVVTRELSSLSAELLAPTSLAEVRASDPGLEAVMFKSGQGRLLAIANRTGAPISAAVGIGANFATVLSAVGGPCTAEVTGKTLRDRLDPLAVHLYRVR